MNAYDFVHIAFHLLGGENGEIKGKTLLQKKVYFLGLLSNKLDELGYHAHYYGPYSPEVAAATGQLRALGFLELNVSTGGGFDSRGFEVARYDFKLTHDGKDAALRKLNALSKPEREVLEHAAEKLKSAGEIDYMKLSMAAKSHFILRDNRALTKDEVSQVAEKFSWKLAADQVKDAAGYLMKIGVVQAEPERQV